MSMFPRKWVVMSNRARAPLFHSTNSAALPLNEPWSSVPSGQ